MITSILISLLTAFLEWLFQQWMTAKFPTMPTSALVNAKPVFMERVQKRFWLGPSRMEKASKLFDKAALRYGSPQYTLEKTRPAKVIAKALTDRLTLD